MPAEHWSVLHQGREGLPLLWIHGLGESRYGFRHLPDLLPEFRHLLVDLPGYGQARRCDPYGLEEIAQRLGSLLSETEPTVVLGHSMGGVIGTYLSELYPTRVRLFVNVDGNISIGDCGYSRPISEQSHERFLGRGYEELLQQLQVLGESDPAHQSYHHSMSLAQPEVVYRHSLELVHASGLELLARRMAALAPPALYLAGVPGGCATRSQELLSEAGVPWEALSPSGHWPFLDQPDAFAQAVRLAVEASA